MKCSSSVEEKQNIIFDYFIASIFAWEKVFTFSHRICFMGEHIKNAFFFIIIILILSSSFVIDASLQVRPFPAPKHTYTTLSSILKSKKKINFKDEHLLYTLFE